MSKIIKSQIELVDYILCHSKVYADRVYSFPGSPGRLGYGYLGEIKKLIVPLSESHFIGMGYSDWNKRVMQGDKRIPFYFIAAGLPGFGNTIPVLLRGGESTGPGIMIVPQTGYPLSVFFSFNGPFERFEARAFGLGGLKIIEKRAQLKKAIDDAIDQSIRTNKIFALVIPQYPVFSRAGDKFPPAECTFGQLHGLFKNKPRLLRLNQLVKKLRCNPYNVIVMGKGCRERGMVDLVGRLAKKIGAVALTTMGADGLTNINGKYIDCGQIGFGGVGEANYLMNHAANNGGLVLWIGATPNIIKMSFGYKYIKQIKKSSIGLIDNNLSDSYFLTNYVVNLNSSNSKHYGLRNLLIKLIGACNKDKRDSWAKIEGIDQFDYKFTNNSGEQDVRIKELCSGIRKHYKSGQEVRLGCGSSVIACEMGLRRILKSTSESMSDISNGLCLDNPIWIVGDGDLYMDFSALLEVKNLHQQLKGKPDYKPVKIFVLVNNAYGLVTGLMPPKQRGDLVNDLLDYKMVGNFLGIKSYFFGSMKVPKNKKVYRSRVAGLLKQQLPRILKSKEPVVSFIDLRDNQFFAKELFRPFSLGGLSNFDEGKVEIR